MTRMRKRVSTMLAVFACNVCVYVCVWMYVCVCAYACVRACVRACVCLRECVRERVHVCVWYSVCWHILVSSSVRPSFSLSLSPSLFLFFQEHARLSVRQSINVIALSSFLISILLVSLWLLLYSYHYIIITQLEFSSDGGSFTTGGEAEDAPTSQSVQASGQRSNGRNKAEPTPRRYCGLILI